MGGKDRPKERFRPLDHPLQYLEANPDIKFDPKNPHGENRAEFANRHYWEIGRFEGRPIKPKEEIHFPIPDFGAFQSSLQQQLLERQRETERQQFQSQFSQLSGMRSTAVNEAISTVDANIRRERDRASLIGLDYDISDEQRTTRISNLFAELFSADQEKEISGLASRLGIAFKPAVLRGEATGADRAKKQTQEPGTEQTVGGPVRRRASSVFEDEEDLLELG